MNNKENIKEINQHISDALEQWSNIMVTAEAEDWAYHLEYSNEDMLNALYIFEHVMSNHAIKQGCLDEKNVEYKISKFCDQIRETFGVDTIELTNKVLG